MDYLELYAHFGVLYFDFALKIHLFLLQLSALPLIFALHSFITRLTLSVTFTLLSGFSQL